MFHVLFERAMLQEAVSGLLNLGMRAGQLGYERIVMPYARTDCARNRGIQMFLEHTTDDHDTLVMLDCDHEHPPDIIERLVAHDVGVVGALCFKRGEPYSPCFFMRHEGRLLAPGDWPEGGGLLQCAIVGTGAIAIQRWVFARLDQAGYTWPYFQYVYPEGSDEFPSEDVYFGRTCEEAGIPHHVDLSLTSPHCVARTIGERTYRRYTELAQQQATLEVAP